MTVRRRCGAAVVTVSCLLFALWAHTETRQEFNGSTQEFNRFTQEFNGSVAGFHRFTQKFDRQYEVSSEEFNRRLLYFQVGDKRRRETEKLLSLFTFYTTTVHPCSTLLETKEY